MKNIAKMELIFFCLEPYLCLAWFILYLYYFFDENSTTAPLWIVLAIIIAAVIICEIHYRSNAKYIATVPVSRYLSKAAFIVKCWHIPFYILLFVICVLCSLLIIAPVIGVFMTGGIWFLSFCADYVTLLVSDVLLWGAIKASDKDHIISTAIRFVLDFFALFFVFDFFIALSMSSKTKKLWKASLQRMYY